MVSSVAKPRGESSRFGGSPHFSVTGMLQDVRPRRDRHWAATSAAPPAEGSPLGLWIFPPPRWRRSQSVIAAGTTWRERPRLSRPAWGEPSGRAARGDWAATSAAPPAFRIFRSFRIFRNFRRFRSFRDFRIFRNFRRFRSFRIFRIFRIIRPLPHQHAQALPSARRLRPSARRFPPQAQRGGCADRCDSRAVRRSCAPGCRPV